MLQNLIQFTINYKSNVKDLLKSIKLFGNLISYEGQQYLGGYY